MRRLNFALIARLLCSLLMFEAVFMIVPAIIGFCYGEYDATQAFMLGAVITLLVGLIGHIGLKPARKELSKYDGVMLTTLIWIVFSVFGMIPYVLAPSTRMSFSEGFFECMSGFTTTGATLTDSLDKLSHAVHIWHCLSEWIGGLGIIIFTVALVPMLNSAGGIQMFNAEQAKISQEKVSPRISTTARRIWLVYILLTAILFGLLCLGPMSPFEAACHALATLSTGGFSTNSSGINEFATVYVKIVITLFMFLGGVNFALVYRASTGQIRKVAHNDTLKTFCKVILGFTLIFIIGILANGAYAGWQSVTIDPLFQVISFITSTGFILSEFSNWGATIFIMALMLMFIGGCAGSTSGGAKIDRMVYMLKDMRNSVKNSLRPNAVLPVRVNGRVVPSRQVSIVVAFLCIYVLIVLAGTIALTFCGVPLNEAFVSSLGSMGNNSISISDTHLGCDYLALNPGARYILSLLMLTGRLEIYSVLVLFTPYFWRQ